MPAGAGVVASGVTWMDAAARKCTTITAAPTSAPPMNRFGQVSACCTCHMKPAAVTNAKRTAPTTKSALNETSPCVLTDHMIANGTAASPAPRTSAAGPVFAEPPSDGDATTRATNAVTSASSIENTMVTRSYLTTAPSTAKPAMGRNCASHTPTPPMTRHDTTSQKLRARSVSAVRTFLTLVTPTNTPIAEVR